MTNLPDPNRDEAESRPNQPRRWFLRHPRGLAFGVVFGLGFMGVASGAWFFIHRQLSPLVAESLENALDRPIEVGPVEGVSLTSLRFGPSTLPATETNLNEASVEAVEARFNPLDVILRRTLGLELTLIEADARVEQNQERQWFILPELPDEPGVIKIDINSVELQDSQLVLVPYTEIVTGANASAPPFEFALGGIDAQADIQDGGQQIGFELAGNLPQDGSVELSGEFSTPDQALNLVFRGQKLPLPEISQLAEKSQLVQLPAVAVKTGQANGNVELRYRPDQPLDLKGDARFQDLSAEVADLPEGLTDGEGQLRFNGTTVNLEGVQATYGPVVAKATGAVDLETGYDITAQVEPVDVNEILETFEVELPVPVEAILKADANVSGPLAQPLLTGTLASLQGVEVDKIGLSQLTAQFSLTPEDLKVDSLQVLPVDGGEITGQGRMSFGEAGGLVLDLEGRGLPADEIASAYATLPVTLGQVAFDAQVFGPLDNLQAVLNWQAPGGTYPGQGEVAYADGRVTVRNTTIQVGSGTVQADALLEGKQWQALVSGSALPLSQISPSFRGVVDGEIKLTGALDDLSPAGIQADGTFVASQGLASVSPQLASVNSPLTAKVRWDGQALNIQEAASQDLLASGIVVPQLTGEGAPTITSIDLDVQANNFDLAPFSDLSPAVQLAGLANFDGQITGNLTDPKVAGALQLDQLRVNEISFDPVLRGDVNFSLAQGGQLNLAGEQDRIEVAINSQFQPERFDVALHRLANQPTLITGKTENNRLTGSVENFPLGVLDVPPGGIANLGDIQGLVSRADFDVDLRNLNGVGEFVVERPGLGYIDADRLEGRIRFVNGVATLTDSKIINGDSIYLLDGAVAAGPDPTFRSRIRIPQGQIQDLLQTLEWFEISDIGPIVAPIYASAADVPTYPVGDPDAPLIDQLRRLAEIDALIDQQIAARRSASPVPELGNLSGPFIGEINVGGSLQNGLSADFEIIGQDWDWPRNAPLPDNDLAEPDSSEPIRNQLVLKGDFQQGVLTVQPLRFESCEIPGSSSLLEGCEISPFKETDATAVDDTNKVLLTFAGQIGGDSQAGRLRARNLPVSLIDTFVPLPVDLQGNLNANATLAGTPQNPEVRGDLNLADGFLNSKDIQSATGVFSYKNARLNLKSEVDVFASADASDGTGDSDGSAEQVAESDGTLGDGAEPIVPTVQPIGITASLPYKLPFMTVTPESDAIRLDVNVRNESLALLNLVNQQVLWEEGEGVVNLQVRGTLLQPRITGLACLTDATFSSPEFLVDPLEQVNGTVLFLGDRILVDNFEGSFPEGKVEVQGALPVLLPFGLNLPRTGQSRPNLFELDPENQCQFSTQLADATDKEDPLTVYLDDIDLRLTSFYQGEVNGNILVTGTALAPQIEGDVQLSNGEVLIPDPAQPATVVAPDLEGGQPSGPSLFTPPVLSDVILTLDKNIQITKAPLLSFAAKGSLLVNGSFSNLRPEGVIRLQRGNVNLFTTQFVLEGGFPNQAEFVLGQGLDPNLQVRLRATVSETSGPRLETSSPFPVSEVLENPFETAGGTQTVRVRAEVIGPASQLFQNLRLSSSPSRGEQEILGLIGGGAINTFTQGDGTLAIANLASNIFFGNFQSRIAAVLGLSEFRVFPTTSSQRSSTEGSDSTLGVGIEAGLNLTSNLAVSALKVVTQDDPTQFGLRYQINDELLFRGSSDFNDDTRTVLEYRINF